MNYERDADNELRALTIAQHKIRIKKDRMESL